MDGLAAKIIGMTGITATLLLAAGQAQAGICPASAPLMTVTGAGFSCTLGTSTFSGFSSSGANPTTSVVEFAAASPTMNAVTLGRDGGTFPSGGTVAFNFTVTDTAPHSIVEASVGIDVGTISPATSTVTTFNGLATTPATLSNSQTGYVMFTTGASSVAAKNTTTIPAGAFVSSITDIFAETTEHGVPEPASLSLFGLGLIGLGFVRRRRR